MLYIMEKGKDLTFYEKDIKYMNQYLSQCFSNLMTNMKKNE